MDHSRDLASCMGCGRMALMRGHGFAGRRRSINDLVRLSVYIPRNARVMMNAMRLGEFIALSQGEIEARLKLDTESPAMMRGWEFWRVKPASDIFWATIELIGVKSCSCSIKLQLP